MQSTSPLLESSPTSLLNRQCRVSCEADGDVWQKALTMNQRHLIRSALCFTPLPGSSLLLTSVMSYSVLIVLLTEPAFNLSLPVL
jgi:hypothetical protein